MQIKYLSNLNCEIKTKNAVVMTNPPKINDFVLDTPGEFEVAGVMVEGMDINGEKIFVFDIEEMKICYIDGIEKKLENKELDFVSVVDIVIAPVEEENKTKLDQIQEIVNSIDPKMVVVIGEKKDEAEKVFGAMEKIDVLKISKTNLPEEGRQIIALG